MYASLGSLWSYLYRVHPIHDKEKFNLLTTPIDQVVLIKRRLRYRKLVCVTYGLPLLGPHPVGFRCMCTLQKEK